MRDRIRDFFDSDDLPPAPVDGDVVELRLLLQGWQVTALETAAHDRGLTAGQMVRSLLQTFLVQAGCARCSGDASGAATSDGVVCGAR